MFALVVMAAAAYVLICKLFKQPLLKAERPAEETTLYRKERVVQNGSQADKFINVFIIAMFLIGGCLIIAQTYAPGLICFLVGVVLTKRKINQSKIENYEKIITPAHWPKDCQYPDYNQGLQAKTMFTQYTKEEKFYKRCLTEGVDSLDGVHKEQKALLIAQDMKLKDLSVEAIRRAFASGEIAYKNSVSEGKTFEREQELSKLRIDELQVLAGAMKYYGLHGRDKRIAMLEDMYEEAKKNMKEAELRKGFAKSTMLQKEHDWAIHGGIASGIAGPAAGLVTAMQVETKNAAIREYNAQMAPYVSMVTSACSDEAEFYKREMQRYRSDIQKTNIKLVADDPTQKVFENLIIKNMKYAVSETGAVVVEADFDINENYCIFEEIEPSIDGVVAARLIENGVHVGTSYFVLPVDGVHKKVRLASICTRTTKPNAKYEVEYSPVDLWAIEKV